MAEDSKRHLTIAGITGGAGAIIALGIECVNLLHGIAGLRKHDEALVKHEAVLIEHDKMETAKATRESVEVLAEEVHFVSCEDSLEVALLRIKQLKRKLGECLGTK